MTRRFALSILKGQGIFAPNILNRGFVYNRLGDVPRSLYAESLALSAFWSKDVLEDIQRTRLRSLLSHAADTIPLWKSHLLLTRNKIASSPFEVLRSLPILQKSDLREAGALCINPSLSHKQLAVDWQPLKKNISPPLFGVDKHFSVQTPGFSYCIARSVMKHGKVGLLNLLVADRASYPPIASDECFAGSTSGSTGKPLRFILDKNFAIRIPGFYQRMFSMAGGRRGDLFVRFSVVDRPFFLGPIYFPCLNFSEISQRFFELAQFLAGRSTVLYAPSSFLIEIARLSRQTGISLNLRSVIAASEAVAEAEQGFVEDSLSCRLFRCYTTRELGYLAHECERGGLHINSEWAFFEIIDGQGNILPPDTTGRIVVAVFDNLIMPFIRYDTGDLGAILSAPCPCGRKLPLLRLYGRDIGLLFLPGGKVIHHFELLNTFAQRYELLRAFQIIQEAENVVKVLIAPIAYFPQEETLLLQAELQIKLGSDVRITIEPVKNIADNGWKRKLFVSKLQRRN